MTYFDRITFNPEQCDDRPCICGMRIRVKDVLDLLAAGVSDFGTAIPRYDIEIRRAFVMILTIYL
jgi:uncharacterized protein (DUF433 family)